jgi:hypothetical protein
LQVLQGRALGIVIAGLPKNRQGVLVCSDCLIEPLRPLQGLAEVIQHFGLPALVVGLPANLEIGLMRGNCLIELAQILQGEPETTQRDALAVGVSDLFEERDGCLACGYLWVPKTYATRRYS